MSYCYDGYCYDEPAKQRGRQKGRKLLKAVADELGLAKGQYDLRWNPGGIAVFGETTLHTDHVYVQYEAHRGLGILVRVCKGRKDFRGGPNNFLPLTASPKEIARFCQALMSR